jgi:hypothetical protein
MIPAIRFAFKQELYLIGIGLTFSMVASCIYHLCDTDLFCLMELSFNSLQVFDILFCNVMVVAILIFYAPIAERTHNNCILILFGLMLSITANNPTNAFNLIFSFSLAIGFLMVTWIYYYCFTSGNDTSRSLFHLMKNRLTLQQRNRKKISVIANKGNERKSLLSTNSGNHSNDYEQIELSQLNRIDDEPNDNNDSRREIEIEVPTSPESREEEEEEDEETDNYDYQTRNRRKQNTKNLFFVLHGAQNRRIQESQAKTVWQKIYGVHSMILGAVLGIVGLVFFALQNRTNYWIFHSCWHVCVMVSVLFLLKGKYEFFELIEFNG